MPFHKNSISTRERISKMFRLTYFYNTFEVSFNSNHLLKNTFPTTPVIVKTASQSGFFGQMAKTAGGGTIGSAVDHTVGAVILSK